MTLLFSILRAAHANGTHHKLALDALRHLKGGDAERWRRLMLQHAELYMQGAKAPDKEFKDFQNHVLHVRDNMWGGAPAKAANWNGHLVTALRDENWGEAAWCAGVLSHYYTDPLMPFHTAQSEAESAIHRATEWSISKSYDTLWKTAANKCAAMEFQLPGEDASLEDMVIAGARFSNRYYEKLIAHYDINLGVSDPQEGLDDVSRRFLAEIIAYASVGLASLLDRAFREAAVAPPEVNLSVATVLATLKIPLRWLTRKMDDAAERELVKQMYFELQETGTVDKTLSEDDRMIRDLYAREVMGVALPKDTPGTASLTSGEQLPAPMAALKTGGSGHGAKPTPSPEGQIKTHPQARLESRLVAKADPAVENNASRTAGEATSDPARASKPSVVAATASSTHLQGRSSSQAQGQSPSQALSPAENARQGGSVGVTEANATPARTAAPTFRLSLTSDVTDAPSIGPKTAVRLKRVGIQTVADLLEADPDATAAAVKVHYFTGQTLRDWQDQARLACCIPELTGTAAQLLVAVGLRSPEAVAKADAAQVAGLIEAFATTPDGERLLRSGTAPTAARIAGWLERARTGRRSLAA